ncbi:MAG: hypothetical protein KKB39_06345 [Nanoarchaeota archaeon]|nr:hypothetical protein [Nanoarchaeota archaeon]
MTKKSSMKHPKVKEGQLVKGNLMLDKLVGALIENNIALQHKLSDLILDMKDLNSNVKNMVKLFTEAGEHIKKGKYEDPLINKLDDLLEQNKNIAKGLLLLEKFVREKSVVHTSFPKPFGER